MVRAGCPKGRSRSVWVVPSLKLLPQSPQVKPRTFTIPLYRSCLTRWGSAKKINGSEIVGGGNSRSGVACGSAILHHCCPPFKDADRDLLRLLLMTSAARVQCRSDVDGSWSRPTSFLRDRRGFPVSSADFLGRHRRRPVLVSGVHANFLTHVSAKAASTALTCDRLRCEIYLTTQV